ncbi:hypothetical protein [Paenibacillus ottowii]
MLPIGLTIEEQKPGDWRICLAPNLYPPAGKISGKSYSSFEEAKLAAEKGIYD